MTMSAKMHVILLQTVVILLVGPQVSGTCVFGTDADCAFQCHCQGGTCDSQTGRCSDGCAEDTPSLFLWSGEACQIGNVARGKPTAANAGLAVDGHVIDQTRQDESQTCAVVPAASGGATWSVDLGQDYVIHNVTVFNTNDESGYQLLQQFHVMVDSYRCGFHRNVPQATPSNSSAGSSTIKCDAHPVGRIVTILKPDGGDMTLCEVVVTGHKAVSCDLCDGQCSKVTGCLDCPAGTKRPDCVDACDTGYFGPNCQYSCSGNCFGKRPGDCSAVDGSCPQQCQPWYIGQRCEVYLELPLNNGENVTLMNVRSTSVDLVWEQNTQLPRGMDHHYGYQILAIANDGPDGDARPTEIQHDSSSPWRTLKLRSLQNSTRYEISVKQFRRLGTDTVFGQDLSRRQVTTRSCSGPDPPVIEDLTAQPQLKLNGTVSFTVSWQGPKYTGCYPLRRYEVGYRLQCQGHWQTVTTPGPDVLEVTVGLTVPGSYEVQVAVIDSTDDVSTSSPRLVHVDAFVSSCTEPVTTLYVVIGVLAASTLVLFVALVITCIRRRGIQAPNGVDGEADSKLQPNRLANIARQSPRAVDNSYTYELYLTSPAAHALSENKGNDESMPTYEDMKDMEEHYEKPCVKPTAQQTLPYWPNTGVIAAYSGNAGLPELQHWPDTGVPEWMRLQSLSGYGQYWADIWPI